MRTRRMRQVSCAEYEAEGFTCPVEPGEEHWHSVGRGLRYGWHPSWLRWVAWLFRR